MPLARGARLGPYEISELIGAGGMGEVYRARDTRIGREVAVKLLPSSFADDRDRVLRFEREARAIGLLSHPNLLSLFDVGTHDSTPYLVTELLEGATLPGLLRQGPVPWRKAIEYAMQIARGLDAAHGKGIIHRDLKPANVFVARDGRVKVLDFGLAKLTRRTETEKATSEVSTAASPTDAGVLLGTVGYMSPEQVRGQPADERSDIFALGAVLYEMLSGKRAFKRDSQVETLNAILQEDPLASEETGVSIPPALARVVRQCLEKSPDERFRSAHDLAFALEAIAAVSPKRSLKRVAVFTALAIVVLSGAMVVRGIRSKPPVVDIRQPRFQIALPHGVAISTRNRAASYLALSPDGERVAFVGCKEASCLLYVRGRRELDAQPIADTDGAACPFFSPDGRFIGFGANGKLKRVPAAGGPLVTLAETAQLRGGSWGPDGTILFTGSQGGLMRVAADGGEAHRVTQLDPARDISHRWPQFLPGGRAALLDVLRRSGTHDVAVADLSTGAVRILVEDAGYPRYAPSGDLLFGRLGTVYAAPFGLDRLTLNGWPTPVLEGVVMSQHPAWSIGSGVAYYDVAQDGTLLYSPLDARLPKRTLVWVDRAGRVASASSSQRSFTGPILSRDGRRLAVEVGWELGSHDVFVADLERDAWTRITADGRSEGGAWLPGADRLIVDTAEADHHSTRLVGVDGSTLPDNLFTTLFGGQAAVAPDGRSILIAHEVAPAQWDISRLPLEGDRVAEPWLATPASEFCPSLSSDGRYVAYRSDVSGRAEVYVRPYSGSGQQHQVSTQGGNSPLWSRDGREIFFASRGGLWSARVRTAPTFAAEIPRRLFDIPDDILVDNYAFYDVSPDGRKFVMVRADPYELRPIELVLVPSWTDEVKGRQRAGGTAPH